MIYEEKLNNFGYFIYKKVERSIWNTVNTLLPRLPDFLSFMFEQCFVTVSGESMLLIDMAY